MNTASVSPYESIFVSYSHRDSEIVKRLGRAYKALGMKFLRDAEALRSGEEFHPKLVELIDKADIFQLYWSEAASNSSYVQKEWKRALARQIPSFIRPVYWKKPMTEPPEELKGIHFTYYPQD